MSGKGDPPTATRTLSEHDSKLRLAAAGVAIAPERLVATADDAVRAAGELGLPVAVKLCGAAISHKTERGLVRLDLGDATAVRAAATDLLAAARPEDGDVALLVCGMVRGKRELIVGAAIDPTFGRCVMLGIGGIFAEALADVAFRLVPLTRVDAEEMIEDLVHRSWLETFRGEPAVDRAKLADTLVAVSRLLESDAAIVSIDLNPIIIHEGCPIAVDALVEVAA